MEKLTNPTTVAVDAQGQMVIPSEIRRELGIAPGDVLLAHVEDQRLVLEKREEVLQRVRQRFANIPAGVSLVDELIAERRAESGREEGDSPQACRTASKA